jgi:hypothetical protein
MKATRAMMPGKANMRRSSLSRVRTRAAARNFHVARRRSAAPGSQRLRMCARPARGAVHRQVSARRQKAGPLLLACFSQRAT